MVVDASNDRVVDEIMDLTNGAGVDVAVDYVSTQGTQEQAVGSLGDRRAFRDAGRRRAALHGAGAADAGQGARTDGQSLLQHAAGGRFTGAVRAWRCLADW